MTRKRFALLAALAVLVPLAPGPGTTGVALAHEPYFREAPSPHCADEKMLKRIAKRFAIQARDVHHAPELAIADIVDIHQHRYIPQDVHKARPIARRYCHATAILNDGRHRKMWYLIEGGAGFASYSDNVEFCLSGFDRWNVYDASCRVLR